MIVYFLVPNLSSLKKVKTPFIKRQTYGGLKVKHRRKVYLWDCMIKDFLLIKLIDEYQSPDFLSPMLYS